jgi:capsular exopolysaccharide synthesis family protein
MAEPNGENRQENASVPDVYKPGQIAERPSGALSTQVQWGQPAEEGDNDTINLRDYWEIILKRKGTVLTFFAIVVVAVMTATFLMTPIFRASLTLQIDRQEAKVVEYQGVTPMESAQDSREFYQTQYEVLKSRSLAQRVIDQLNLTEHPEFNKKQEETAFLGGLFGASEDKADAEPAKTAPAAKQDANGDKQSLLVNRFLANLTVEPVRNSRLVKIHFDSPDAALATRIVNAVATAYINLNLERRMDASSYAKTFLQDRLQQIQAKLEDSEKALVAFARQEQIIKSSDEKQDSIDAVVMQEFTGALAKAQQERIRVESVYNQLKSTGVEGLPDVLESRVIQELKQLKAKLEAEYQEGLKIYKPAYPKMLQMEGRIAETQAKIDEEIRNVKEGIKVRYDAAKAAESALSAKLQESKRNVLGVQDRSIQYNILKREVDTNRQLYEGLLQRLKEVGVAGGIGVNNISIVDKAEEPNKAYKPKKLLNLLIGIFLGLFGGIALAFLFEHLDDTIKQPDDIEKLLGLSVLGVIPFVRRKTTEGGDNRLILENMDLRSAFAESYRSLRTAMQFSTPEGMPKVLMITSSSMGEGKSTTAISLATHFALAGKTVLLIDADLRKASTHKNLKLDNSNGLTNYLAGDAKPVDITQGTEVPNLYAITSGPLPPNPAELLSSGKMVSLLTLAAEKFDQVIVDGPPVLGLADAPLLGNLAEATALVIEAGGTRRDFARGAVKRLRATRTRLVGAILTKVESRGGSYGYYHSYYYYQYGGESAPKQLT